MKKNIKERIKKSEDYISKATLLMMDKSIKNFINKKISDPIDIKEFKELINNDE